MKDEICETLLVQTVSRSTLHRLSGPSASEADDFLSCICEAVPIVAWLRRLHTLDDDRRCSTSLRTIEGSATSSQANEVF